MKTFYRESTENTRKLFLKAATKVVERLFYFLQENSSLFKIVSKLGDFRNQKYS